MSERLKIEEFLGLTTSVNRAPANTAANIVNLVRHKVRGRLELAEGYARRWTTGLPQVTDPDAGSYFNPAIYRLSMLEWQDFFNFRVPDHGGADIAVLVGTYRKSGFTPTDVDVDRFGVWARPYWDGDVWVDEWKELTEMFIFEILELPSTAPQTLAVHEAAFTDDASVGDNAWNNLGDAECGTSGFGAYAQLVVGDGKTHYLKADGQAITIPDGARVIGVELTVERKQSDVPGATKHSNDNSVRLVRNGAIVGDDKASAAYWDTNFETVVYGAADDTWHIEWRPGDTIGAAISAKNVADATQVQIKCVRLTVTYIDAGGYRIVISEDALSYNFAGVDPEATVFNDSYFTGWTLQYADNADTENFDLICGCGFDGLKYYLTIPHKNDDYATRPVGTTLYAYRNFQYKSFPESIVSQISTRLAELRLTTGNNAEDVSLLAGFRTKTFPAGNQTADKAIDALLTDTAALDIWPKVAALGLHGIAADDGGVPVGDWYVKWNLVTDDGNETKLYDAQWLTAEGELSDTHIGDGPPTPIPGNKAQIRISPGNIRFRPYFSLGALPRRMAKMRIFLSPDDVNYFFVKEISLTDAAVWTYNCVMQNAGAKHCYEGVYPNGTANDLLITGNDWTNPGPEALVQLGRGRTDAGVMQFSGAAVINGVTFAWGIRTAEGLMPNTIATSTSSGSGRIEGDVLPDSPVRLLDVEYNDGDEIRAVAKLSERILVLKRRSVVLLTQVGPAQYQRERVTSEFGITNVRTLAAWNDGLIWMDYNGVYGYTAMGPTVLNPTWNDQLKAMTAYDKERAFAIIDRANKLYRLFIGVTEFAYELQSDVEAGESARQGHQWIQWRPNNTPGRYVVENDGTIDMLLDDDVYQIGGSTRQAGIDFSFQWKSNPVHVSPGKSFDILLQKFAVSYESDVDLTFKVYLDGSDVALEPWTLPAGGTIDDLRAPLSSRCKSFQVEITGTTTDEGQSVKITQLDGYYDTIPGAM